ncbi:ABC transporter permease [Aminobacter sp. UC22_36]|uniref:ABC transporter permease n=1 Tax=Aminobacter sp. UC22_36 TaxID=3374549 RepID=UPI0037582DA8
MIQYLSTRLVQGIVLLFLVSLIVFSMLLLAPGSPLAVFAFSPGMTSEDLARISAQMGLDRPIPVQYCEWLFRMLRGDWGVSYRDGEPVLKVIGGHLPATLLLMGSAMSVAAICGVWMGLKSAMRHRSLFDNVSTTFSVVALSIPTFWFGLVAIFVFSVNLGWFPAGNMYTVGDHSLVGLLHHLVLPVSVLALVEIAQWSRYMRSATLEVMNQDFVKTAKAKGLSERAILLRHIGRNAMLPMIPLAGLQLPSLFGGALVTETVFTWPGMGRLFIDSLGYKDYPVIMGLMMLSAVLVVIGSLCADIVVALVDPRIRLNK